MADFLSDLTNLANATSGAANSLTNLFKVRTDLESARLQAEISKADDAFIARTFLKVGDKDRIDRTNWREALEAHKMTQNEILATTKWRSVEGKVRQNLEPLTSQFNLKMGQALYAQEQRYNASLWMASVNDAGSSGDLAQLAELEKQEGDFMDPFERYQVMAPVKERALTQRLGIQADTAVKIKRSEQVKTAAAIRAFNAIPEEERAGGIAPKPITFDAFEEAMNSISKATEIDGVPVTETSRAAAMTALNQRREAETKQFNEVYKAQVTDIVARDGDVDLLAVERLITDASNGFVDKQYLGPAIEEVRQAALRQGYTTPLENVFSDSFRTIPFPEKNSATAAMARQWVKNTVEQNKSWAQSVQGQETIEGWYKEIDSYPTGEGDEPSIAAKSLWADWSKLELAVEVTSFDQKKLNSATVLLDKAYNLYLNGDLNKSIFDAINGDFIRFQYKQTSQHEKVTSEDGQKLTATMFEHIKQMKAQSPLWNDLNIPSNEKDPLKAARRDQAKTMINNIIIDATNKFPTDPVQREAYAKNSFLELNNVSAKLNSSISDARIKNDAWFGDNTGKKAAEIYAETQKTPGSAGFDFFTSARDAVYANARSFVKANEAAIRKGLNAKATDSVTLEMVGDTLIVKAGAQSKALDAENGKFTVQGIQNTVEPKTKETAQKRVDVLRKVVTDPKQKNAFALAQKALDGQQPTDQEIRSVGEGAYIAARYDLMELRGLEQMLGGK